MSRIADATHDPALLSWVKSAQGHPHFPIQNLPLGVFSPGTDEQPRIGTAIGDEILDLRAASELLPEAVRPAASQEALNALFALPPEVRMALRARLSELLSGPNHRNALNYALHPASLCTMHMPAEVGDYTDFYVGIHHATNVGSIFRPDNPLLPNYKHVPIGYHGRASSLQPSGVPVVRPNGQSKAPDAEGPSFGPSRRLDYELELGIWIGAGNPLGQSIPVGQARDHVAGFCLLNDWSARDIQAWEYVPLGPFLAKSFQSTISPWVVTTEALAPYGMAQPARPAGDPRPLPYLWDDADQARGALGIQLTASISTTAMREQGLPAHILSQVHATNMYWTVAQMVAHHSSNGCNLNPGDLLGTGTLSGAEPSSYGSLLELTKSGTVPITLPTGETRTFVEDGDEISINAFAEADGLVTIGFGECRAIVVAAP